jgi:hypothetical protein
VAYFYSTVRFVPDPARGEFINLGAIVGDDESRDWALRQISNLKRANAIDSGGALPAALEFIGRLEETLPVEDAQRSRDRISVEQLTRLSAEMNNIIQFSSPAPIVADTAEAALDLIFEELVLDPASMRFRFEKKHRAVGATRGAYRAHEIPDSAIKERVQVVAGSFHGGFDFAVHNGRAIQLVQCWSFQLPNQESLAEQVKAWAWVVRELREQGGRVQADTLSITAPGALEIGSVCIPPAEGKPRTAFDEAQAAFDELEVESHTPETADALAVRAAAALGGHSSSAGRP